MDINIVLLIATFFVSLVSSALSGIASGGGGFISGPWQLLIGFSPAEMVATGSVGGTSITLSSLHAMRKGGVAIDKRIAIILSLLATITALMAAFLVPRINPELFRAVTALVTFGSLPFFFSRHHRLTVGTRSQRSKLAGYVVLGLLLLAGAVLFSSAFSLLIALALPFFFGTSTLESAALRRVAGTSQMLVLLVSMHQYIVWHYTIATITGGAIGSYLGTHFAIRKGEAFARKALTVGAIISAVALLV